MKKILYLANNADKLKNKIYAQCAGFEANNMKCDDTLFNYSLTIKDLIAMFKLRYFINKYDFVYVRMQSLFLLFYPWLFCCQKTKVILEIPTPISVMIHEIRIGRKPYVLQIMYRLWLKIFLKLVLRHVYKIIEYSDEKNNTILYYKQKIIQINNGVDFPEKYGVDEVYLRLKQLNINTSANELNLIMVANLQEAHGLERAIYGLYNYYKNNEVTKKITLTVIAGECQILNKNRELTKKLNIMNRVIFITDVIDIKELTKYYQKAHIGLGAMGSYLKNIKYGSAIKVREYILLGLPVVLDYHDYDVYDLDFVLQIKSSDTPLDINEIINFYDKLIRKYQFELSFYIYRFAINNLLWSKKFKPLIDILDK